MKSLMLIDLLISFRCKLTTRIVLFAVEGAIEKLKSSFKKKSNKPRSDTCIKYYYTSLKKSKDGKEPNQERRRFSINRY